MLISNQIISYCRKGWDVRKGIKVALEIAASFRTYHFNHCSTFTWVSFKKISSQNPAPVFGTFLLTDLYNANLGGHDSTVLW